jgi:hypothetical protein
VRVGHLDLRSEAEFASALRADTPSACMAITPICLSFIDRRVQAKPLHRVINHVTIHPFTMLFGDVL